MNYNNSCNSIIERQKYTVNSCIIIEKKQNKRMGDIKTENAKRYKNENAKNKDSLSVGETEDIIPKSIYCLKLKIKSF